MKISMHNFQVYDALSIFFELEKPHVKHFEGFILLPREGNELQKISELLTENSN
jgi:precorrin-6B methylase 1